MDKVKKIRPIILESGHMDSDLNVGDKKKIEIDIKNKIFLSYVLNFKDNPLKKK